MKPLEISTYIHSDDFELFAGIVNQGIDSRLTGFTKSTFYQHTYRYYFNFHPDEVEILMRRLSDIAEVDNEADMWEDDILSAWFGVEVE